MTSTHRRMPASTRWDELTQNGHKVVIALFVLMTIAGAASMLKITTPDGTTHCFRDLPSTACRN